MQKELGWFGSGKQMPGFHNLSADDQQLVMQTINPVALDEIPEVKKPKMTKVDRALQATIKQQNTEFFDNRDFVKEKLLRSNWVQLLEINNQEIPQSDDEKLDAIAELLTFGALKRCPVCNDGQLTFTKNGYICTGNISEWAKCDNFIVEPLRVACKIPVWLQKYFVERKVELQVRAIEKIDLLTMTSDTFSNDVWL